MNFETFICSSDNTHDVFDLVFLKNTSAFNSWKKEIFVGSNVVNNNSPFVTISAPLLGGWREELLYQITELKKKKSAQYVFLLLDDFYFFEPISYKAITKHALYTSKNDLDYLRLVKPRRSFLVTLCNIFSLRKQQYTSLGLNEPYYTSLQPAIWKIDYLIKLLSSSCNIWEFEHLTYQHSKHAAVTKEFLSFTHLVEKGRWLPKAFAFIDSSFHKIMHKRGIHQYSFFERPLVTKIKFYIFGYFILKCRKYVAGK
jgi:hypothetical protein